ncbi:MAG TPA: dienelactone hydrolase family protein [Solirubrobacteraceae bacterium]|jgi:carboxymethylenebutenolidase|nr:dienelactone hydrolase family protein [Solirubrobacteraceae bacterium]
MSGETIDIETKDGVADAYLARPDGEGSYPGVLLLIDAFGLRPRIEEMADRIAAQGFVVLAPNVFYRAGRAPVISLDGLDDPEKRGEIFQQIMPLMQELNIERIVSDADAYLGKLEGVARGPIALTGYCMGGRLGWQIAAAYPRRVAALGAFHTGGLVTEAKDSPHLIAGEISAELYFGFADNDHSMPAESITTLEKALDEAGASYVSEIYEGAAHGYTMSDTPAYDEAAAERHFAALFDLLGRTVAA